MNILVTGATGYIGGRLVPRLLELGHCVHVLVRDPGRIAGRAWADQVKVFTGDLLKPETLPPALANVDVAYYLVHSMYAGSDFGQKDREAAENFVAAAAHLKHIIYLGGLVPEAGDEALSKHLSSRAEVGDILGSHLPITEFRAGPIIGSGSASFEMVRYLTERLPVMIAPRWVLHKVQPIAIRDMMHYLLSTLDREPMGVVNVGAEPLKFLDMMMLYAETRGYRRRVIPVPVLAPSLAALWVGLVTPITNRLAVPLVQGMIQSIVAGTDRARELFPEITPMTYRDAVQLALQRIDEGNVETHWSGALRDAPAFELTNWGGLITEMRTLHVSVPPEKVFDTFCSLGGQKGWLSWNWAWKARGLVDQLVGGPGLRRGRRHPTQLLPGEAVDFWRVETVKPGELLRLRAEMKVPGKAWLEFQVGPEGDGSRLAQTATFAPYGVWGNVYWYALYPLHKLIFSHMVKAVARDTERTHSGSAHRKH